MDQFKEGDKVVHSNWGKGVVSGEQYQDAGETVILVEFEQETDHGMILDVSVAMLELIRTNG